MLQAGIGGGGHDQVVEALEAARRRAEWEKHEKWLRKLEAGNHDTSKLRANLESTYSLPVVDVLLFCYNLVNLMIAGCV